MNMIKMTYDKNSLIDPVGRVVYIEGNVYRVINKDAEQHVIELFESGLVDDLIDSGLIPNTVICDVKIPGYSMVLSHERIRDPSYVQEWSFSMLKEAAILILDIEKKLLNYGYHLKDCHSYNVMFKNNAPIYVDFGSITRFTESGLTVRQYFSYYDQLLDMFSKSPSIARERILSRFDFGARFNHYLLHGMYDGDKTFEEVNDKLNRLSHITDSSDLIDVIEKEKDRIRSFEMHTKTPWANYQAGYIEDFADKGEDYNRFGRIIDLCVETEVSSVLELAANQGVLSLMISELPSVETVISTDYDEQAIDFLYKRLSDKSISDISKKKIHPMVYDITREFCPCISLDRIENRIRSDMVIALALMHHLILGQNIDLSSIVEKLYLLCKDYLVTEFMPLGLWGGEETVPPLPTWYTLEWFLDCLETRFDIITVEKVLENRVLIVCRRRD